MFPQLQEPQKATLSRLLKCGQATSPQPSRALFPLPTSYGPQPYCEYHKWPGHSTSQCSSLRKVIHDMIDKGTLPRDTHSPELVNRPQPVNDLTEGGINHVSCSGKEVDPSCSIKNIHTILQDSNQPRCHRNELTTEGSIEKLTEEWRSVTIRWRAPRYRILKKVIPVEEVPRFIRRVEREETQRT